MKYYKTQNGIRAIGEKGDIDGVQSKLVQKDWIEISYDEMMEIINPAKSEEVLEQERIDAINQKANEIIEAKYPLYKQLNIRGKLLKDEDTGEHYNDTDIEIMNMFIDTVRGIAKQSKSDGTSADEVNWAGLDE